MQFKFSNERNPRDPQQSTFFFLYVFFLMRIDKISSTLEAVIGERADKCYALKRPKICLSCVCAYY